MVMPSNKTTSNTDYLIIGGGSAGCTLASRLSESGASVTLIEAGSDTGGGSEPEQIKSARFRTSMKMAYLWPDLVAEWTEGGGLIPLSQARVLGGGSSINGMHCQRGLSSDYDEWRELGVTGWGWDDVLPFFKRLENDVDYGDNGKHGNTGPVRIARVPDQDWSQFSHAFADVMSSNGSPRIDDVNDGESGDGYGAVPLNINGDNRLSTATAFLTPEVRKRANLRILTETHVASLTIESQQVVGAVYERNGHSETIRAAETILCAGAIHSPALLMRSGIGPAADLQAAGVKPIVDLPGVGSRLQNHPALVLVANIDDAARSKPGVAPPCPVLARYSSGLADCPSSDMMLNFWERTPHQLAWDPMAHRLANIMVLLNKPYSEGSVKLNSSGQLDIRCNTLSDSRDMQRMIGSLKLIQKMLLDTKLSKHIMNKVFLPTFTPIAFAASQNNWKARAISMAGALALSLPGSTSRKFLEKAGTQLDAALEDESNLESLMKSSVIAGGHPSGTCRMGDPSDKNTVLDSRCRVVGIDGLRVVDASIFPTMTTGGPNLPVMMAAEKVATMIVEDAKA